MLKRARVAACTGLLATHPQGSKIGSSELFEMMRPRAIAQRKRLLMPFLLVPFYCRRRRRDPESLPIARRASEQINASARRQSK
jgi:hypothetical protein